MTRLAERNALRRHLRVRGAGEIRHHQPRHIDQHRWLDCFACARAYLASHLFLPSKASLTSQIHVRLGTAPDPPGSAEANLKAMDGAVVLERDRERSHGDRHAIELGGGDATLHALRVLDNDLIPRGAVSEHYLETGP